MSQPQVNEYLHRIKSHVEMRGVQFSLYFGFWLVALMLGIVSGAAAVVFRIGIEWFQSTAYGTSDVSRLQSFAETLSWYWVVLIPTLGGVIVSPICGSVVFPDPATATRY